MKTAKLRRTQLDRFFKDRSVIFLSAKPKYGWVKEIRQALGMSMQDLGERLGVVKQRIERIEKDEVLGKLTIESLQAAAQAMNCDLVYFLVPKGGSLQNNLEEQARKAASEIVHSTELTMGLEAQNTSKAAQRELVNSIAQQLLAKEDRRIWRNKRESAKSSGRNSSRR